MSLYRKYRPTRFDEIIGQPHVTKTLQNAIKSESVSHAYLFTGPRGTGKTSIARILARELGCAELDIVEIDAASHRGIDEVRALREQAQFHPTGGDKKIYILDEVHMLTKEAFNALLKLLEEPPSFVYFVLCTTEPHKVPVTIISRTQRFDFKPGSVDDLLIMLKGYAENEGYTVSEKGLALIAEYANGGFRDAASFLEQVLHSVEDTTLNEDQIRSVLGLVDFSEVMHFVEAILQKNTETALGILDEFEKKQVNISYLGTLVLKELRNRLLEIIQAEESPHELMLLIKLLTEAFRNIKYSPVEILPLQTAIISFVVGEERVSPVVTTPDKKPSLVVEKVEYTQLPAEKISEPVHLELPASPVITNTIEPYWQEIMQALKTKNHTLEALLKGCDLGDIVGDVLVLEFKYKFHKEKIDEVRNRQIIEETIEDITRKKITLSCILKEDSNSGKNSFHGENSFDQLSDDEKAELAKAAKQSKNGQIDPVDLAMKELDGIVIQAD